MWMGTEGNETSADHLVLVLHTTLKTVSCQVPLSMKFSRQEYWSGLPPSPGYLPNAEIEPRSPELQAGSSPPEPPGKPKILEWVAMPSSRYLPNPGIEPESQIFFGSWVLCRWSHLGSHTANYRKAQILKHNQLFTIRIPRN